MSWPTRTREPPSRRPARRSRPMCSWIRQGIFPPPASSRRRAFRRLRDCGRRSRFPLQRRRARTSCVEPKTRCEPSADRRLADEADGIGRRGWGFRSRSCPGPGGRPRCARGSPWSHRRSTVSRFPLRRRRRFQARVGFQRESKLKGWSTVCRLPECQRIRSSSPVLCAGRDIWIDSAVRRVPGSRNPAIMHAVEHARRIFGIRIVRRTGFDRGPGIDSTS